MQTNFMRYQVNNIEKFSYGPHIIVVLIHEKWSFMRL